jgi:hypothetical protein
MMCNNKVVNAAMKCQHCHSQMLPWNFIKIPLCFVMLCFWVIGGVACSEGHWVRGILAIVIPFLICGVIAVAIDRIDNI